MEDVGVLQEVGQPPTSPYDEWGRLTRFLESARLTFARERKMWASLDIDDPDGVRLSTAAEDGRYTVALNRHIDAVDDAETLHGSVLIHSYALAESAAGDRLGASWRSFRGIEDWGARLLGTTGRDWSDVKGGLAGAVEVAIVRNAFAHGTRTIDELAEKRLFAAGARTPRAGTPVTLTYTDLREFRGRLLSLLNQGGIRR